MTQMEPKPVAVDEMPESVSASVEAVLLSVDRPIPAERLAQAILRPQSLAKAMAEADEDEGDEASATQDEIAKIDAAVSALNEAYARTGRSFRIESVAGGYRVMTLAEHAPVLAAFKRLKATGKLSRAAVETLAIIAYRQPVTRAELEAIRGVACGEVLKNLLDRRLVTIKGRAEELGRPLLYGTTKQFLDHFGLATIKDLPAPAELKISI
jgi:segregation and condensation protein B